jgi:Tfp pilus assembly protein PilO
MTPHETGERRSDLKAKVIERLHDPLQLRVLLLGLVLAAGYVGIYMPLTEQIAQATANVDRERKLADLADGVEQLQARYKTFAKRLPHQADSKEWMQYLHEGIRGFPVTLLRLDCLPTRPIGPYRVVTLQVEVAGSLYELDTFLRWIEANPRLFRVDDISIALVHGKQLNLDKSERNLDDMVMKLTVVGMAG